MKYFIELVNGKTVTIDKEDFELIKEEPLRDFYIVFDEDNNIHLFLYRRSIVGIRALGIKE